MKLDPAIVLVVKRIAQEFKKLRRKLEADIEALSVRVGAASASTSSSTPGPKGDPGPPGPAGADGADGGSQLAYTFVRDPSITALTDPISNTLTLPAPPTVTGKTFVGLRFMIDSDVNLEIASAASALPSATIIELPVIHVSQVTSSLGGFTPRYHYRRAHVAGAYDSAGSNTGTLRVVADGELFIHEDDFTPDGVETLTIADLGYYIPDYVEGAIGLSFGGTSGRIRECVRVEYEYTETLTALTATATAADATVTLSEPPVENADGSIEFSVSGGHGPYYVVIDGVGTFTGATPTASPLARGDYDWAAYDAVGNRYPASGWNTVHVYREAFDVTIDASYTLALVAAPATRTFNAAKYDEASNPGELVSVTVATMALTIRSTARIENTSGTAGTAVTTIDIAQQVEYPAGTPITNQSLTITPQFSNALTAYDGIADYGGTSGVSNAARSTVGNVSPGAPLTPVSDFVGVGTVAVTVASSATGSVAGVAPYLLNYTPQAAVTVTLQYAIHGDRI